MRTCSPTLALLLAAQISKHILRTYHKKTPIATTALLTVHPPLHFPVPFQFATAAKADNHIIQ
jgi:hypothetical protein